MSETPYEPIVDEDGQTVGYMAEAEDGAIVGIDLDGLILAAVHPETGEPLDASEYELAGEDEEPSEQDWIDDYDQRITELEEHAEEPVRFSYERVPDELDEARLADDLDAQLNYMQRMLGRPLLLDEKRRLAELAADDVDAGDARPDLLDAAARAGDMGEPLLDLDSGHRGRDHEARTAFMAQRISDQDRYTAAEQGADDLDPIPPPSQGVLTSTRARTGSPI